MTSKHFQCLLPLVLTLLHGADSSSDLSSDKAALSLVQEYIGSWRGVGQLRRGSNRGAWIEQSEWVWKFTKREATLRFTSSPARFFSAGTLRSTGKPGQFQLVAIATDGNNQPSYTGNLDNNGQLVLVADHPVTDKPARVSVRLVADGKRLVVLYERLTAGDRYIRMAEVGYTRKGSNFGKGTAFVECVVTGGKGTIPVTHKGKTYYVCCSGCKDLFEEDPEGVLAEYREQKAAEKEKVR